MIVEMDKEGRISIPAEYQHKVGITPGDEIMLIVEDGELRLFSAKHGLKKAQEIYRKHIPADRDLVSELIAERRAEAILE